MKTRRLGTGPVVSAMGLGCMGMSEFYGKADDATSLEVLHRAVDLGITFLDTADMYGPYHNEELIGRFLREAVPDVTIATKFGIVRRPGEYARTIDNSEDYMRAACEESLRRLGREAIDLYYVHRIDKARPIEETMEALGRLVQEGKILHVGLCEVNASTLRRAHAVHPVTALQTEYSLWTRDVEAEVLPTCRELGIGFVAYSPLGRGFLTGAVSSGGFEEGDFRAALPRFAPENAEVNGSIVNAVREVGVRIGSSPAQVALAWLLAQGGDIVPIPGTKRLKYLEENIGATSITLDAEALEDLASAARLPVAGARYTAEGMKGVDA